MNKGELVLAARNPDSEAVQARVGTFVNKIKRIPRDSKLNTATPAKTAVVLVKPKAVAVALVPTPPTAARLPHEDSATIDGVTQTARAARRLRRLSVGAQAPAYGDSDASNLSQANATTTAESIAPTKSEDAAARGSIIDGVAATTKVSRRLRRLSVQAQACGYDDSPADLPVVSPRQSPSVAKADNSDDEMDAIEAAFLRAAEEEAAVAEREEASAALELTNASFFSDNVHNDTAEATRTAAANRSKRSRRTSVIEMAAADAVSDAKKWMQTAGPPSPRAPDTSSSRLGGLRGMRSLKQAAHMTIQTQQRVGMFGKFLQAVHIKPKKVAPFAKSALGLKARAWAERQKMHQLKIEAPNRKRSNLTATTNTNLKTKDILDVLRDRALVGTKSMAADDAGDALEVSKDAKDSMPDAWKRLAAGSDLQVHEPSVRRNPAFDWRACRNVDTLDPQIWKKEDRRTGVKTWGRRVTRESMARSFETGADFKKVRDLCRFCADAIYVNRSVCFDRCAGYQCRCGYTMLRIISKSMT